MNRTARPMPTDDREPPRNIEAEQALIGAVLLDNAVYRKVGRIVEERHFSEDAHQRVWHVLSFLIEQGAAATPVTLKTYFDDELAPGVTVPAYLARLVGGATTTVNADFYAKTVRDLYLRREVAAVSTEMRALACDAPVELTVEQLFRDLESKIERLRPTVRGVASGFESFGRISIEDLYEAYRTEGKFMGVRTGFSVLDETLAGMRGGDFVVIAGRPGIGKTALATSIAVNASLAALEARAEGREVGDVGFFSLEMTKEQLKHRIVADRANVSTWKLRRGIASAEEMDRIVDAEKELRTLPLRIDADGELTISQLRMKARDLKRTRGLSLILVDYLQIVHGSSAGGRENRTQEVTEISNGLKAMAKELDVPVIALSQLSRGVESRDDRRPQLSDLRESGAIEQDADTIMLIYREEYYLRNWKPQEGTQAWMDKEAKMRRYEGVAEVNIAKNRHGPAKVVEMGFEGGFVRFTNDPPPRDPEPEQVRERPKKHHFTADGTILWGVIKTMSTTRSRSPTTQELGANRDLNKNARMIKVDDARAGFARESGRTLEETAKEFTAATKNLRKGGLVFFVETGDKEYHLWAPEYCDS